MNRWHNVHDALPAIDAECIVLDDKGRISFAHMVDTDVAVDYDGWNIPNVAWWTHFDPSDELEEYYGMSHGPMSRHEILKLSQIFCHNHCNKDLRLCCDFYIERGPDFSCPQLAQFQTDVRYVFNDGYVFSDDYVQTDNEEE